MVRGMILLGIPLGFYAYAPRLSESLPLRLDAGPGVEVLEPCRWRPVKAGSPVRRGCQMPQTLALQCPISAVAS